MDGLSIVDLASDDARRGEGSLFGRSVLRGFGRSMQQLKHSVVESYVPEKCGKTPPCDIFEVVSTTLLIILKVCMMISFLIDNWSLL